jgi:glyoxylase I family protein
MPEIKIETIDHVSLPVAVGEKGKEADPLKKSKEFYSGILGLKEIGRPATLVESIKLGAWYQVGESRRTLHLIANEDGKSTFRKDKELSSRDIHFALRISNFLDVLKSLLENGYHPDAKDELKKMKVSPTASAGFPQIFIMDPDRNVIELNVGNLLTAEELKLVNEELEKLK